MASPPVRRSLVAGRLLPPPLGEPFPGTTPTGASLRAPSRAVTRSRVSPSAHRLASTASLAASATPTHVVALALSAILAVVTVSPVEGVGEGEGEADIAVPCTA